MSSLPSSGMVVGSIGLVGVTTAAVIVPPFLTLPVVCPDDELVVAVPPQAAMKESRGRLIPTTEPARMNSLREMWPANSSSMTLFSSSDRLRRTASSRRWVSSSIVQFLRCPLDVRVVVPPGVQRSRCETVSHTGGALSSARSLPYQYMFGGTLTAHGTCL